MEKHRFDYDVIIIGAGPGGIYSAYELTRLHPELRIGVFEAGSPLEERRCPIDGKKVTACVGCPTCAIMNGFGGAGAFSDGKYNITNDFGGTLYEHIGREEALELMRYVDEINMAHGGEGTRMYSTAGTAFKKICMQNKLQLLEASVRHLGTDINYVVLKNLFADLKETVDFRFRTPVQSLRKEGEGYRVSFRGGEATAERCIVSVGRSGSKWMEKVCSELGNSRGGASGPDGPDRCPVRRRGVPCSGRRRSRPGRRKPPEQRCSGRRNRGGFPRLFPPRAFRPPDFSGKADPGFSACRP